MDYYDLNQIDFNAHYRIITEAKERRKNEMKEERPKDLCRDCIHKDACELPTFGCRIRCNQYKGHCENCIHYRSGMCFELRIIIDSYYDDTEMSCAKWEGKKE